MELVTLNQLERGDGFYFPQALNINNPDISRGLNCAWPLLPNGVEGWIFHVSVEDAVTGYQQFLPLSQEVYKTSPPGAGISWLWQTSRDDPFFRPACWHDWQYDLLKKGESTKAIDDEFLRRCMAIAKGNLDLEWQAYSYYVMCRAWGSVRPILQRV